MSINSNDEITLGETGLTTRFLVEGEDSGGSVAVFEFGIPAGADWPGHSHGTYEETMYVLEGVLTLTIEGAHIDVGPSEAHCIRRGVVHRFANRGAVDVKGLAIISPGTVGSAYFREVADLAEAGPDGRPELAAMQEVWRRHGDSPEA